MESVLITSMVPKDRRQQLLDRLGIEEDLLLQEAQGSITQYQRLQPYVEAVEEIESLIDLTFSKEGKLAGFSPVTDEQIENLLILLSNLLDEFPCPSIFPLNTGDIGLEWTGPDKGVCTFSVAGDKSFIFCCIIEDGNEESGRRPVRSPLPKGVLSDLRDICYPSITNERH